MQNNTAAENWAAAQATAANIAREMIENGRMLSYDHADELGEQAINEIRVALRAEGYTLSTEDTEVMWAEEDE